MAKCNFCGNETELFEAGTPICPACIDQRERKHARLEKTNRCPNDQPPPSTTSGPTFDA